MIVKIMIIVLNITRCNKNLRQKINKKMPRKIKNLERKFV